LWGFVKNCEGLARSWRAGSRDKKPRPFGVPAVVQVSAKLQIAVIEVLFGAASVFAPSSDGPIADQLLRLFGPYFLD
jgi:hypothetical protein